MTARAALPRVAGLSCLLLTLLLPGAGGSAAAAPERDRPTVVSVPDPFAPLDCGQPVPAFRSRNSPREPIVAANPADPDNVVVAYIVDSNLSNLVRVTKDQGRTWSTVTIPGLTACSGGVAQGAADPSLAFSADGSTLYLTGLTLPTALPVPATNEVVVTTSRDGGLTWAARPTTLSSPDGLFGDKNIVTTDPVRPRTAYVAFERHDEFAFVTSTVYVRRTDDAGATWSPAVPVYSPGPGFSTGDAQVLVTGSGRLVSVFTRIIDCLLPTCADPSEVDDNVVFAATSDDGGRTWSGPVRIGQRTAGPSAHTGVTCENMTASPTAATGSDGRVYVVIPVDADGDEDQPLATSLAVFASTDGTAWSAQAPVSAPTVMALPALAVAGDGTLGLTYYQREGLQCVAADAPDPTRLWFASSRDGGQSWTTRPVSDPFDAQGNCFLGGTPFQKCAIFDYAGITALGKHGFAAVFEVPRARGEQQSDIYFARLRVHGAESRS